MEKYEKEQEKQSTFRNARWKKIAILIEISLKTGEFLFCLYFTVEKVFDWNPHKYMQIVSNVRVAFEGSKKRIEQFSISSDFSNFMNWS